MENVSIAHFECFVCYKSLSKRRLELRTQNSEFYLTTLPTHRRGHRFINASWFSNGWYWNKAGEYSLTKLTKKYNHQCLNKEMMPYLVSVMLSGVPLRHRAAIIGPLQQYNLNEKETDVAETGISWANQNNMSRWCFDSSRHQDISGNDSGFVQYGYSHRRLGMNLNIIRRFRVEDRCENKKKFYVFVERSNQIGVKFRHPVNHINQAHWSCFVAVW